MIGGINKEQESKGDNLGEISAIAAVKAVCTGRAFAYAFSLQTYKAIAWTSYDSRKILTEEVFHMPSLQP